MHKHIPDVIVRHVLEMSMICNFGGLLGMWLGLSLVTISKDTLDSIRHYLKLSQNNSNVHMHNYNIFNSKCFIN